MSLRQRWTQWQTSRFLHNHPLDNDEWHSALATLPWLSSLDAVQRAHLRMNVLRFMEQKQFSAAGDFSLDRQKVLLIALLASLLWPHEEGDIFPGWVEVIVYPGDFSATHTQAGDAGVMDEKVAAMAGESWLRGPVILSWDTLWQQSQQSSSPHQLVFHEFAHKLDGMNGAANGMPPLPRSLRQQEWTQVMTGAYERLNHVLDQGQKPWIDPYAATAPAEFFAVLCEVFFRQPQQLAKAEPGVFSLLCRWFANSPGIGLIPEPLRQHSEHA
ncbi:zinc-dependent peptidase [Pokkaliibacter sp. CJK22405]|uniref:M90 family metallopeptidase n=1 Tax=Pokkaliibacter sp. CJK22405 TaxID=3384615 RepID=UPI0039854A5D